MIKTYLHASHINRKNIGLERIIFTRFSNRKKDSRLNVVYSNKFFCVIIWLQKTTKKTFLLLFSKLHSSLQSREQKGSTIITRAPQNI